MIEQQSAKSFSWRGGRDCVSFAARAVKAQSGVDILGSLKWNNRREAQAIIDAEGGLALAVDRRLERVPEALASRGDIAAVADAEMGIRLMVVEGRTLVGPGARGLARLPRSSMIIAWDAMSARSPHE